MSAYFLPNIKTTYFDQNGDPLSGGSVFTYVSGTTVPAATYTTTAGLIQNTNPIILDASGSADIYLAANVDYKFVVYDRDGVLIDRVEPVFALSRSGNSDVSGFGGNPDGITDNTAAIAAALTVEKNGWHFASFTTPGTYLVNGRIQVPNKSVISIGAGCIVKFAGTSTSRFINGEFGNATYASGYAGNSHIYFTGQGIIDCSYGLAAITFAHSNDIRIEGLTFQNSTNTHFIEINSSKDVLVQGCHFKDMVNSDGGLHEMLQFDYANAAGFPSFGSYDNTPCKNVLVTGCTFENGHSGVGSHSNPVAGLHAGMTVRDCAFYNMDAAGVRVQGWAEGSVVDNCRFENCGAKVIQVVGNSRGIEITNNTVVGEGSDWGIGFGVSGGIYPSYITCKGNKVYNCTSDAFYFASVANGDISNNEVYSAQNRAFRIQNGCSNLVLSKNRVYGAGLQTANTYDLFYIIDASSNIRIEDNFARTLSGNKYKYGVYVEAGVSGTKINKNDIEKSASDVISDNGTLTEINGETFLTDTLSQTTGTITLLDSITKYDAVLVGTGVVAAGDFMTGYSRGWRGEGFRVGTDFINVIGKSGITAMAITDATTLTISGTAPDAVRYIIGVNRK